MGRRTAGPQLPPRQLDNARAILRRIEQALTSSDLAARDSTCRALAAVEFLLPAEAPAAQLRAVVVRCRAEWGQIVRAAWSDRGGLVAYVERSDRMNWSPERRHALRTMLRRRAIRPILVVEQLVAWELGLTIRQIRQFRSRPDELHA